MLRDWRSPLAECLINAANPAGAWGYRALSTGSPEPTALAALALTAVGRSPDRVAAALQWLARLQRADGAIPVLAETASPCWPTALALLAWLRCAPQHSQTYVTPVEKASEWLTSARGRAFPPDPTLHDHDTRLVGWPWVEGCHSWLEPTGFAVLALRAAGMADHPRVREGVQLILDRALPGGGWNYGNRRVLEHVLHPFPATTGVALAALAGEPRDDCIEAALKYLTGGLQHVRAPLSLAWGLIGMQAWKAQPAGAQEWLEVSARRLADQPASPHYDALLLLAGAEICPLVAAAEVQSDE
jgi:hypothetical protein